MKKKTKPIFPNNIIMPNYQIDTGVARAIAQWNTQMQLAGQGLKNAITPMSEIAIRIQGQQASLQNLNPNRYNSLFSPMAFATEAIAVSRNTMMPWVTPVVEMQNQILMQLNKDYGNLFTAFKNIDAINFNWSAINLDGVGVLDFAEKFNESMEPVETEVALINEAIIEANSENGLDIGLLINKLVNLSKTNPYIRYIFIGALFPIFYGYLSNVVTAIYPPDEWVLGKENKNTYLQTVGQSVANDKTITNLQNLRLTQVNELNVRNGASIDAAIVWGLKFGSCVEVLKTDGEWCLIKWKGVNDTGGQGWVKNRYLTEIVLEQ